MKWVNSKTFLKIRSSKVRRRTQGEREFSSSTTTWKDFSATLFISLALKHFVTVIFTLSSSKEEISARFIHLPRGKISTWSDLITQLPAAAGLCCYSLFIPKMRLLPNKSNLSLKVDYIIRNILSMVQIILLLWKVLTVIYSGRFWIRLCKKLLVLSGSLKG